MTYEESVAYIYSTINRGVKLGLQNISSLLEYFGNPQLKVPTIHIAGTNGKGSTSVITASILQHSGYRVGLFTSPHLQDFRERIRINQVPIAPEQVADLVTRIRDASQKTEIQPTYFELGVLMAFLHFHEQSVDWNVIEVGMGGRLDATNTCQAETRIITSIARDHVSSLGKDLESIAYEKACIIKNSGTVIAGVKANEILQVIEKQADKFDSPVYALGRDFEVTIMDHSDKGLVLDFSGFGNHLKNLEIPLLGRFQAENAALAMAACLSNSDKGLRVSDNEIMGGLKEVQWPGRMEVIRRHPTLVLDCAHNPDSVKNLAKNIRELFNKNKIILIIGILEDKELAEMLQIFSEFGNELILTRPQNERACPPHKLRDLLEGSNQPIEIIESISSGLTQALSRAQKEDVICITGSIFTVAEARKLLETK